MGASSSEITQAEFAKAWKVSDELDGLTVWENRDDPSHQLEEYSVQDYDEPQTQQLYKMRKGSPYLVNAYSLKKDGIAFCDTPHESTRVFIEKIPLRLSNVQDIPYPDVLHLYDVCINGFGQLAETVGFFAVDEDFIGVNEQGQVRVWLNSAFESSAALGRRGVSEAEMVEGLLELIHNATDQDSFPPQVPNLSDYLGFANNETTFDSIRQRFVSFVRQHNDSTVPLNLSCVHAAGGAHQVKDWCRSNYSHGFQQNSMRLSERFYQSKQPSNIRASLINSENRQTLPAAPSQIQPANFTVVSTQNQAAAIAPQFQTVQLQPLRQQIPIVERTIQYVPVSPRNQTVIISNPIQTQSVAIPRQIQPAPIASSVVAPASLQYIPQAVPAIATPLHESSRKQVIYESNRESEVRLQQQRVISQTIEVRDSSKISEARNTMEVYSEAPQPASYSPQIETYEQTKTYRSKKSFEVGTTSAVSNLQKEDNDGKSSPEFLALLSSLKNPKTKAEYVEVYSQVADTPSSYVKENSESSSGKKYFNYTNMHETYSQDAFSSFGQDSNKNIGSTVINNYASHLEEQPDKYSGQYNFSKYDRAIDPELMADMAHYN